MKVENGGREGEGGRERNSYSTVTNTIRRWTPLISGGVTLSNSYSGPIWSVNNNYKSMYTWKMKDRKATPWKRSIAIEPYSFGTNFWWENQAPKSTAMSFSISVTMSSSYSGRIGRATVIWMHQRIILLFWLKVSVDLEDEGSEATSMEANFGDNLLVGIKRQNL